MNNFKTKNAKTLLFASLITAMILPFSVMETAYSEEEMETKHQDKLDKLKERYDRIQDRIDRLEKKSDGTTDEKIAKLKERQDRILEKAMKINQKYINTAEIETDVKEKPSASQTQRSHSSSFGSIDIKRTRIGCDSNTEVSHAYGYVVYGSSSFWLTHNYQNPVSVGNSQSNCIDYDWDDQIKVYADNIWNIYEGCYAYFSLSSYGSNNLICPGDTFDQGEWWYFETTGYYDGNKSWKMGKQHIL